mgnify:CR=1 FL=1
MLANDNRQFSLMINDPARLGVEVHLAAHEGPVLHHGHAPHGRVEGPARALRAPRRRQQRAMGGTSGTLWPNV